MKYIIINLISVFLFIFKISSANADLISLDDHSLGSVDGAGIGFVLEDFVYEAGSDTNGGATFEISGLETSTGGEVVIGISQFYVSGGGSEEGDNVLSNPVNIGRLNNPFNLELRDGNDPDIGIADKAVFEFSAPKQGALASRSKTALLSGERPDMGVRFDLNVNGIRKQSLENHVESVSIDGSFIRLWGDGNKTHANLALNIYTPKMTFFACDANGINCGQSVDFLDLSIESELGYGDKQPVTFEVDGDGNFIFEVGRLEGPGSIKNLCGSFSSGARGGGCTDSQGVIELNKFYTDGPKANVYIGNVIVGNESFGSSTVSNLQIQYLHVKSHDL